MIRTEQVADDLITYLRSHVADALSTVGAISFTRGGRISLPDPNEYHIGEPNQYEAYNLPAVFIIDVNSERVGEREEDFGNYDHQTMLFFVAVRVEERTEERLTRAVWRYVQALDNALQNASITEAAEYTAQAFVMSAEYGITYTDKDQRRFRKDARLDVQVQFIDSLTMADAAS